MKPALFFAVIRSRWWGKGPPYEILEITTERGGQLYGRDKHEAVTHVPVRDVLARCSTREAADIILANAEAIKDRRRDKIKQLRHELNAAESAERAELSAMIARH